MYNPNKNFNEARERLIQKASNLAAEYFANKTGSFKLSREPKVELSYQDGPTSGSYSFSGKIICYASTPVLQNYEETGLNMTVNNNDVSIESEETVADKIENSLNSSTDYLPTEEVLTASLDGFHLTDIGYGYLSVGHKDIANIVELGIVAKNEYSTSPNKSELLQTIVKDAFTRIASQLPTKYEFTGSFVEPKIEKKADDECMYGCDMNAVHPDCPEHGPSSEKSNKKEAALGKPQTCSQCGGEVPQGTGHYKLDKTVCDKCTYPETKKSWLTSDMKDWYYECPVCKETFESENEIKWHNPECKGEVTLYTGHEEPEVSINENMPLARMSGGVEQSMQAEQQKLAAEKDKLSNTAVNQLIPTLQSLGFGSARVSEVTPTLSHSDNGFDGEITAMTFVEDKTSTKLVAFPIKVKASQIELPKLPLVRELINKAIDLNERLAEQLTKEALLSLSSVDEKTAYEANEVKAILEDKIEKIATENGLSGVQLVGPQDTITLQKHLLPIGTEDLAIGDKIFGDGHYWQLVDKEGMQNDKNSESSSLWKFVKCEPPKEKEEPAVRIPE